MTDNEKLQAERDELNKLIGSGQTFFINRTTYVRKPGLLGRFKRREKKTEKLKFTIQEPTLAVLDLLSAEQIELVIEEAVMQSEQGLSEGKKMVNRHAIRMARIVALAVMGEDYIMQVQQGARVKYDHDDKRLAELTQLFANCIKPSQMFQLVLLVNAISNNGDFMNSIRLMSASRTTMPILIEDEQGD